MTLPNISMFKPLFYSAPIGASYCSPLWDWRFELGDRSSYMAKAESLADIHNAIPQVWRDEDQFVLDMTGNIDAGLE